MSILTAPDPPIDLLLPRFVSLCQTAVKPYVEINYPIVCEAQNLIEIDQDSEFQKKIAAINKRHIIYEVMSPLVESSTIIPLHQLDFDTWSQSGLTISTWVNLKSEAGEIQPTECQQHKNRIHLLSIGSEKLLISFYINFDGTLSVYMLTLDVEISSKKPTQAGERKIPKKFASMYNKENENTTNSILMGVGIAAMKSPQNPKVFTRHQLRNRTRLSSSQSEKDEKEFPIELLKSSKKTSAVKFQSKKWIHLSISLRSSSTQIVVLLTFDGLEQELFEIPLNVKDLTKKQKFQFMCVGSTTNCDLEEDSLRYSMSKVSLFKFAFDSPSSLVTLCALGPDEDSFIECQINKPVINYGFIDYRKKIAGQISMSNPEEQINEFRKLLKITYSACRPEIVLGYKSEEILHGEAVGHLVIGKRPEKIEIPSIHKSIIKSGGLSSLLFLFARTVELTGDPVLQAKALHIFLKLSHSNNDLFKEFQEKKLFNLVAHVFKKQKCLRGPDMMKAVMDVVCGVSLYQNLPHSGFMIVNHSELCISHPGLIFDVLEHYSIFDPDDSLVLDLFLGGLLLMTRESHQNFHINVYCLKNNDFLNRLLLFCEVYLTNTVSTIKISKLSASAIVSIMKLLNSEPSLDYIKKIFKLILLLHQYSETFVTHDRSKFFFLLPPNRPIKSNKKVLPNFNKKLGLYMKMNEVKIVQPFDDDTLEQFKSFQRSISVSPKSAQTVQSKTEPIARKKSKIFDELDAEQQNLVQEKFKSKEFRPSKRIKYEKSQKKRANLEDSLHLKRPAVKKRFSEKKRRKISDPDEEIDPSIQRNFEELMQQSARQNIPVPSSSVDNLMLRAQFSPFAGIYYLHEQLLMMMCEFLITLPDTQVQEVLQNHLKIEILIVLANHEDPNVRAALIKLVCVILERTSAEQKESYMRLNYWVHFGNQISISTVNCNMIQACMEWIGRGSLSISSLNSLIENELIQKEGLLPLIACLPKIINDTSLFPKTSKYVRYLIDKSPDSFLFMIEKGLIASSIKALANLTNPNDELLHNICKLLKMIAYKCLVGQGQINGLWELLYGLTYVEKAENSQKVRDVHVSILLFLLNSCVIENQNSRRSYSRATFVIQIEDCELPASEVRTRFKMIYERSIQYLMISNPRDPLSETEMEFVKFVVNLTLSGFNQGSSILLWGLAVCRPVELKILIIRKLWALIQTGNSFTIDCETKLVSFWEIFKLSFELIPLFLAD